jgi:3-hydroxyacyl-[acyl-carrier-protein] dehydratase
MLITKEKIQNYIPQRPPFVMVDNLIEAASGLFKTDFTVLPGNVFLEGYALREFALIENIAQSSSAGLAVTGQYKGKSKPDGYLGGISRLKLYELPHLGDTILTLVTVLARFENMFLVKGVNYLHERILMECELKIAGI